MPNDEPLVEGKGATDSSVVFRSERRWAVVSPDCRGSVNQDVRATRQVQAFGRGAPTGKTLIPPDLASKCLRPHRDEGSGIRRFLKLCVYTIAVYFHRLV